MILPYIYKECHVLYRWRCAMAFLRGALSTPALGDCLCYFDVPFLNNINAN